MNGSHGQRYFVAKRDPYRSEQGMECTCTNVLSQLAEGIGAFSRTLCSKLHKSPLLMKQRLCDNSLCAVLPLLLPHLPRIKSSRLIVMSLGRSQKCSSFFLPVWLSSPRCYSAVEDRLRIALFTQISPNDSLSFPLSGIKEAENLKLAQLHNSRNTLRTRKWCRG